MGGRFRDVSGWECADWFAGDEKALQSMVQQQGGRYSWGREVWFEQWEREHRGQDAGAFLNRLCTADVNGAVGMILCMM
ncbi:hypothetical protein B484DRAFT_265791 [Ochromonadaceae sp. CCMP2298]|nr:hypothetical protein B484DRAFT_265791 [Ochromonadaceae sp. CCMP2298]